MGKVTHGHSLRMKKSETYTTWIAMLNRCTNPKQPGFKNYGGNGVTVCDRWMKFDNFLEDMGERPDGSTIDRIDNNKGYFKENCKWSTKKEQGRNKTNNNLLEINGASKPLSEWCEMYSMPYLVALKRIKRGWSAIDALSRPVGTKLLGKGESNGRARLSWSDVREIRSAKCSCRMLAKKYGVSPSTIERARNGLRWKSMGDK